MTSVQTNRKTSQKQVHAFCMVLYGGLICGALIRGTLIRGTSIFSGLTFSSLVFGTLMLATGCGLLKNNQQAYLNARVMEPLRVPASLQQQFLPGRIRPIPALPASNVRLPQYTLPGRPQPTVLAEQQHRQPAYPGVYRNTAGQHTIRLMPAQQAWHRVGDAIKAMGYNPVTAVDNRYYQFVYENTPVRIMQLRTQQAIYLIVQDEKQKDIAPELAVTLLAVLQSHLG